MPELDSESIDAIVALFTKNLQHETSLGLTKPEDSARCLRTTLHEFREQSISAMLDKLAEQQTHHR